MATNFHTRSIESFFHSGEATWDNAWARAQEWAQKVHGELTPAPFNTYGMYNEYYGATITFEPKIYAFEGPLRLGASMHLKGSGAMFGTILYFPGSDGIIAEYGAADADGDGKKPFGQDSLLENLYIKGEMSADTDFDGILMRTNIIVRDCRVSDFSRDGIHIEANLADLPTAPRYGNANSWKLFNVAITGCGRHGLYTDGGDANAGTAVAVSVTSNGVGAIRPIEKDMESGRYAIYDSSFLGNAYVSCHVEGCNANSELIKSGGFKAHNYSTFFGCYAELDSPCDLAYPAIWVGRGLLNMHEGAPPVVLGPNGFENQIGVQTFYKSPAEKEAERNMDERLNSETEPPFSAEIPGGLGMSTYMGREFDQILWMSPMQQRLIYEKKAGVNPLKRSEYLPHQLQPPFILQFDFGTRQRYDLKTAPGGPVLSFKHETTNDEKLYFPRGFQLGFGGTPDRFIRVCSNHEPPHWDPSIYIWEEGDVVFNSQPSRAKPFAGWIYTAEGWKPYGRIEF